MNSFKYYATSQPIFWTPNSEWKPNRDCLNRMIPEANWIQIALCPVSWVDNFTVKTILEDPYNYDVKKQKWTLLRIEEYENGSLKSTKYFYLQSTAKRLRNYANSSSSNPNTSFNGSRGASEYIGTLDVWLTYGLDLIEKLANDNKHPILVERFLHPRMFRKYLELKAFKQDDELFNYQSEEKVLAVSAQPQLLPGQRKPSEPPNKYADFIFFVAGGAHEDRWSVLRKIPQTTFQCVSQWTSFSYDKTFGKTNKFENVTWYHIVLADDATSSYTIVLAPSKPTTLMMRYYKYNSTGGASAKAFNHLATKDEILEILAKNQQTNGSGYWTKHIVGIYKVDALLGSQFKWCVTRSGEQRIEGNNRTDTMVLCAYEVKPDDIHLNTGGVLDVKNIEQKNFVNSFYPSAFIRLASGENPNQQVFQYAYLWHFSRSTGYDTVNVFPYDGLGTVHFAQYNDVDLNKKHLKLLPPQNTVEPWVIKYNQTGDEPLNVYAMGRVKYWDTYLNPSFRWLSIDYSTSMRWFNEGQNTFSAYTEDGWISTNRPCVNVDGIGFNGSICYTGNHWVFSTNGSWGYQIHTGNETLPLLNSSYQTYLASQRSQINTGLQINKELYSTQMKHIKVNEDLANQKGVLGVASSVLSGITSVLTGDWGGLVNSGNRIGQSVLDLKQKQEDNRFAKEQASNQYRHYNMKLNAQLADMRASAKPDVLLTSDAETIVNNALESLSTSSFIPFTYLWTQDTEYNGDGEKENSTTGFKINSVSSWGFRGFTSSFANRYEFINTTCCLKKLVQAPLDKYGRQFYNRLTWNVGMKGNFYATGFELFNSVFIKGLTEPTQLTSYGIGGSYDADNNNFYFLKLSITPDTVRQFAQYETLEVYDVLANMFNDGVRIWTRDPAYASKDFIITGALTKDYYDYYTEQYTIKNPVPVLKGGSKCSSTETDLTKSTKTTKKRNSR